MHQHSRSMLPSIFNYFLQKLSNKHTRQTRATTYHNLHIPRYSTNKPHKSIKYQGTKLCNSLSYKLRNQSFSEFKRNYELIRLNTFDANRRISTSMKKVHCVRFNINLQHQEQSINWVRKSMKVMKVYLPGRIFTSNLFVRDYRVFFRSAVALFLFF